MTDFESPGVRVGIDIGGTKTHLRAEPLAGGPRRDHVLPTADWRRNDWGRDAEALLGMAGELAAGMSIKGIGVGSHGCDDATECLAFQSAFEVRCDRPVRVVNDAELMPLALGLRGQIGIVAGTGSIAVCRRADGEMLVAGGWGWIIGDEGSAASLVREAVRAVALHFDAGGGRGEPLVEAILETLNVPAIPRLGSALRDLGTGSAVGGHARAVFEAAAQGSALAVGVIEAGGRALAELPALLERRGAGASDVVAGGSVIASQDRLWRAFEAGLAVTAGHLMAHRFTGQPVEGACRLAAGLIDDPIVPPAASPFRAES